MKRIMAFGFCLLTSCAATTAALADNAPDADNTAQNKGSNHKHAVTAEKQGNSKNDVEVTAAIRRAVMQEKGLSVDAQNIKIIYKNGGAITLKGPVANDSEKTRLEEIAKGVTGVSAVNNMITVKKH